MKKDKEEEGCVVCERREKARQVLLNNKCFLYNRYGSDAIKTLLNEMEKVKVFG